MRALKVQQDKTVRVEETSLPQVGPNDVLIKVIAIGQNPTDWKHAEYLAKPGYLIGCDFVGKVVKVGASVPDSVQVGQIRGGAVRGGGPELTGAFAEYVAQKADFTFLVPSSIEPIDAASLPIPWLTVVQCFHTRLGLPFPDESLDAVKDKWILIWSGSTAVGQCAIQYAKLLGLKVATTCSPRRNELVKSLGAEVIFDYSDKDVSTKLFDATNGQIVYGLDTIGEKGSTAAAQHAFSKQGGHLVSILVLPADLPRSDVKTEDTLGYTSIGLEVTLGPKTFKSTKEDVDNYVRSLKLLPTLLEDGRIKTAEVTNLGGLDDVQKGFELMKAGKHTTKLVYLV